MDSFPLPFFVSALFASACASFLLLTFWRRAKPSFNNVGPKPWSVQHVGLVLMVLMLLFVPLAGVAVLMREEGFSDHQIEAGLTFVFGMLSLLVLLGWSFTLRISWTDAFGLRVLRPDMTVGLAACFLMAILPWVYGLGFLAQVIFQALHLPVEVQSPVKAVLEAKGTNWMILLLVFGVVIAPIFEEIFFRGFAYPALKQKLGIAPSVVIVSLAFAAMHANWAALLPLVALSMAFIMAYEVTGSLLVPIVMHSGFNAVSFAMLLMDSTTL